MGPDEREPDELREEDVTAGDRLDDRVSEGEGLPPSRDELDEPAVHREPDDILPPGDPDLGG